ncbi:MAG: endo alpha-1,4 polygalactosaminidase [Microbacteriaceae bacterium]
MKSAAPALAAASLLALLAGCTAAPADEVTWEVTEFGEWGVSGGEGPSFDYQLGGGYEPAPSVELVVRDRTDDIASTAANICYINGFQSQPGDSQFWLNEHPELILRGSDGDPLIDENWPDEMLLDTSSEKKRTTLASVIGDWIDGCAEDGFIGVEFDNLDSFLRSDGALTDKNNFALAATLVDHVHEAGLQAGQKNAAEYAEQGKNDIDFDFAITEECYRWEECGAYTEVYGDRVFNIEYFDDLRGTVENACADEGNLPLRTIFRDRDLVTPNDSAYRMEWC